MVFPVCRRGIQHDVHQGMGREGLPGRPAGEGQTDPAGPREHPAGAEASPHRTGRPAQKPTRPPRLR